MCRTRWVEFVLSSVYILLTANVTTVTTTAIQMVYTIICLREICSIPQRREKSQQRKIPQFKRRGMTNMVNSLLFTFMNVLPNIHAKRGDRNAVLTNSHLPILNEGHFIFFTLVVSPSSNALMISSLNFFILHTVLMVDAAKVGW